VGNRPAKGGSPAGRRGRVLGELGVARAAHLRGAAAVGGADVAAADGPFVAASAGARAVRVAALRLRFGRGVGHVLLVVVA
jgi:hypothetical protein